jgi:ABC-type polysaccharide/polyol phosphate transport system ATPase subunit
MTRGSIHFDHAGISFRMYHQKVNTLKEAVLGRFRHLREADELWALREASFEAKLGESIGLVGHNGSGKSTLLKLAAGILRPTEGRVSVGGRIAPMLELATGFDPDLSGRDNIVLNGVLMGNTRKEMAAKFDRIVEFSELEQFIDMPVKNYSSGMLARLGFAIATDVDPDILMIDEILAVGDEKFQAKCQERITSIRQKGCTILYVSHGMETIAELCTRVLVLHHGRIVFDGPPDAAIARYRELQGFSPPPHAVQSAG